MFLGIMQKSARSKGEKTHLLRACFRILIRLLNIL